MPIVIAPLFKPLVIVRLAVDDKLKRHFENLGIGINCETEVLSQSGGSIIVRIKDGRIALDKNLGAKIFVKIKEE